MSDPKIEQLAKFTTCDISDALVKFGDPYGGFIPNLTHYSGQENATGFAYTVLFAPLDDPRPEIRGGYIDDLPAGSVLCIGLTESLQTTQAPYTLVNNALCGGLMSARAHYLKSHGTVVFGRIRDVNEHRQLYHPVYAYGTGSAAHKPVVKLVGINVPLTVVVADYPQPRRVTINPQDAIVADSNGVVRLPIGDLDRALEYIPKRVAADELVAEDIRNGSRAVESQRVRRQGL